jgi:uncharacterized repeat protein (TIGR01451 family)
MQFFFNQLKTLKKRVFEMYSLNTSSEKWSICTKITSLLLVFAMTTPQMAIAYQIPTTTSGSWTGTGTTAAATKDTPSGLRTTVSISGSGMTMGARNNTSLQTANTVTVPALPLTTNGVQVIATANSSCNDAATTCNNLGTVVFNFADTAGNPIKVKNPVIYMSRLGGFNGYTTASGVTAKYNLGAVLSLTTPGASLGIASGARGFTVASNQISPDLASFPATPLATTNIGDCTVAPNAPQAGCGSIPVTGLISSLSFNVSFLRDNASGSWQNLVSGAFAADGIYFTVSFDEDYGDAPVSYDASSAASHLISDLALGASITAENITTANGSATGTPVVASSPNAVAAGANNNSPNGDGASDNGVASFPALTTASSGSTYTVPVTLSGASRAGQVCGWIDFNKNGIFDSTTERACAIFASGATTANLIWTIPAGLTVGNTYVRIRASYDSTGVQNPTGLLSSGEVEDYQIPIAGVSDLTITKTHTGNFTQGQLGATYTLTATNSGTLATVGTVSVTDTLPTGLTATAISGNGWTCTLATLTCTRSDALAINASYPAITLTVNVAANAAASLTNSAAVSGGGEVNTTNDTATNPTTINGIADLTVTKTHTGNFTQGQTGAAYILTVTNSGTLATVGTVSITDTLPTGLTATAISGNGWACTLGTLTCTRSTVLAAGSSYPVINLTVNVAANAPFSLINSATVSGGGENNLTNDTATDPTTVNGVSDLTIAKTHTGSFIQGQTGASYSLTVTNSGTAVTSGTVTVVDTLPTGLTATAASGNGWTCSLNTPSAGKVQCTRSDVLALGISYPAINLTVNVAASVPVGTNSITNSASVSGGGETNTANNSATDPTTVTAIADLRLSKTANPTDPTVGSAFNYTITVTNDGPSTATNVQVTDRLPPSNDVSINSASITKSQGSTVYNAATPNIVWTVGTLAPNTSATLTIPATRLLASFTANVAEVTASDQSDPDSTPGNNVAGEDDRASVTVPSQSVDLAVTKSVNNPSPNVGQNVTFTITVTNPSSSSVTATGVGISDPLPAGLTYQSNTTSQGSYTSGTGAWSVGSLSPGTTATLTITAKVNASGTITNTAQLSALDQIDPDPSNNSGNATVTPASSTPNLRLVKRITAINGSSINTVIDPTTTPDPNDDAPNWPVGYLKGAIDGGIVRPSDEVEYTIYFLSDGDSPVRHVQLCDLVPVNSTFIATAFNGLTPTDGGLSGADTGIALAIGSPTPTVYLTNVGGDGQDRGQFLAPNAAVPTSCGTGSNTYGAIVVDVVTDTTTPSTLPNATVPGTPTNSHGFIRFRAKVN